MIAKNTKPNGSEHPTQPGPEETIRFTIEDVTGTMTAEAKDVSRSTPAGAVAQALAHRMSLPPGTPWVLREANTGTYLDEDRPIGDQIQAGETITLSPRTHLGGRQ